MRWRCSPRDSRPRPWSPPHGGWIGRRHRVPEQLSFGAALAACQPSAPSGYQGYVEGEFVKSRHRSRALDQLSVSRGDQVAVGAAAVRAGGSEREGRATAGAGAGEGCRGELADLRRAPAPEQDVDSARARTSRDRAEAPRDNLARDEAQFEIGGIPRAQVDDARSAHARRRRACASSQRARGCATAEPHRAGPGAGGASRPPRAPRSRRPPGGSTRSRCAATRRAA